MQDKRLIYAMIVGLAVVILWQPVYLWLGTRMGYDMRPQQIATATTQPQDSASTAPSTTEASTMPSIAAPGRFHVATAATQPAETVTIGSLAEKDPTYKLALTLNPQGAGIDQVLLNEFKIEANGKAPFVFQRPYESAENMSRPLATQSISINGTSVDLSSASWSLDHSDNRSATYSVTIEDSTGPKLRVQKTFQVTTTGDSGKGYEVVVNQRFENLSDQPLNVHTMFSGPTMPPHESDRGGDRYVLNGYLYKNTIQVTHDGIEAFGEKTPSKDFTKDSNGNPLVWTGACSTYFNALIEPLPISADKPVADYIQNVTARAINPSVEQAADHQIVIGLTTTDLALAPRQSIVLPMRVFFGPRLRQLLLSDYYSAFPRAFNETLVLTSGPCAVCTFQWLINILVWLLNVFHYIFFKDWGLAIIGLVVLVRVLLHPITKRSQISMSKMGKMGPEMERLKKKYGDNKDELNKAMVGFYKEQGATPILGCLPMFLQTPIWIALWQALQSTFELRQAPFLRFFGHNLTWIHDLSLPDHLITFATPINIKFLPTVSGLNLLPILMAVAFFFQSKMQPKPVAATPEQAQQQKMMQWMTLLFPVMLYAGPSGLNLYIMTSTAIGVVESKIVRDHIKQRDEEEKAGKVIVDAGKKFKAGKRDDFNKPKKASSGGIMGWIANLQAKADQLRREAEKRK